MRSLSLMLFIGGFAFAAMLQLSAGTAHSRPQYKTEFIKTYVKPDGTDADKAFAAAVKEANCNVCHEGKKKSDRNAYGMELAKILRPKEVPAGFKGETDPKKIDEAFEKVSEMHIDPKDSKSPTYGELIKQGKLPASESKPADADKK